MYQAIKKLFWFQFILLSSLCYGNTAETGPPRIGNFALPTSQQPGAFISFGGNIIDKNQTQLFLFADDYFGVKRHSVDLIPSVLYGIADNFSIFLNMPIAASFKADDNRSSGLEDAFVQFEYAYHNGKTKSFEDQATLVVNMTFPTGSSNKIPPTGFGSPSFFLGATYNLMYVDWFWFTSHGVVLATNHHDTKFGDQFLYELGFGRNICDIDSKWIFAWMLEVDGTYSGKNTLHGSIDPNSGGNVIYITPSLWISSKKLIFQIGAGWAATEHLFGNQKKENYLLAANVGWTI
ncbi:MAG: hypothetical protein ACHQJ6_08410 [Candidatus Berkiellales bacterium]